MRSATVNLKVDQPDRLLFTSSATGPVVFAAAASAFTWFIWQSTSDEGIFRYALTGFAGLFVIVGVSGILRRLHLDIDLNTRVAHIRRGLGPFVRTTQRRLDEADGLLLTREHRSSGSRSNRRKITWWCVFLKFPEEEKGTRIYATRREDDAYEKAEYFAKRLKLKTIAKTGQTDRASLYADAAGDQRQPGPEARPERPQAVSTPPPGSGLEVFYAETGKEILIPRSGFSTGFVVSAIVGGLFAALGAGALLAGREILDIDLPLDGTAALIVPLIFIIAGLAIAWQGIRASFGATVLGAAGGELYTESVMIGRRTDRKSIRLDEVESIGVGMTVDSTRAKRGRRPGKNDLVVRTKNQSLVFGSGLDESDRAWLESICHYSVSHGQFP